METSHSEARSYRTLTSGQRDILYRLTQGLDITTIADNLCISRLDASAFMERLFAEHKIAIPPDRASRASRAKKIWDTYGLSHGQPQRCEDAELLLAQNAPPLVRPARSVPPAPAKSVIPNKVPPAATVTGAGAYQTDDPRPETNQEILCGVDIQAALKHIGSRTPHVQQLMRLFAEDQSEAVIAGLLGIQPISVQAIVNDICKSICTPKGWSQIKKQTLLKALWLRRRKCLDEAKAVFDAVAAMPDSTRRRSKAKIVTPPVENAEPTEPFRVALEKIEADSDTLYGRHHLHIRVLRLLAQARSDQEIACVTQLSEMRVRDIMGKIGQSLDLPTHWSYQLLRDYLRIVALTNENVIDQRDAALKQMKILLPTS